MSSRSWTLLALSIVVTTGAGASSPIPRGSDRSAIFGKHHITAHLNDRVPSRGLSSVRGYDVVHYDLTIEVLDGSIAGTVIVEADAVGSALADVVLDLHDDLTIDTVTSSHGVAATSRADDFLTITLGTQVAAGEAFTVTVAYEGVPPALGGPITTNPFNFVTHGDDDAAVIYSLSVPWRSGAWWPCKEELSDRATIDVHVTVADTLVAASNGVLQSVSDLGDGRHTFNWSHGHPVTPYLVMLAISDYELIEDSVDLVPLGGGPSITVPLDYYVYPEEYTQAEADFERIPDAMQFLSDTFGLYPFADEKFAMALVPFSGGMEHQTCVSLGSRFVRGDKFYEWVFVHELSHHWWGDHITLADWRDVWLNEGFATYTEALWTEHVAAQEQGTDAGAEALAMYMDLLDVFPPPSGQSLSGRIYDPTPLYGEAPYNKGAWVLHMLRWALGDEMFFGSDPASGGTPSERGILREWVERMGGLPGPLEVREPVTTAAFARVVKDVLLDAPAGLGAGGAVDTAFVTTFFDQWIQEPERPDYRVTWSDDAHGSSHTVVVDIQQRQPHRDVYVMPVEIEVELMGAAPARAIVMNTRRSESFSIDVAAPPLAVRFDPDRRLLRNVPVETSIATTAIPSVLPNPAVGAARVSYFLASETPITVRLFDGTGRHARTLVSGAATAGRHVVEWDGRDGSGKRLGSGVYFVELETPRSRRTERFVFVR